jgi:hypothetical protein
MARELTNSRPLSCLLYVAQKSSLHEASRAAGEAQEGATCAGAGRQNRSAVAGDRCF